MLESTSHGVMVATYLISSDYSSWLCERVAVHTWPVNGQLLSGQKGNSEEEVTLVAAVGTYTTDQVADRVTVEGTCAANRVTTVSTWAADGETVVSTCAAEGVQLLLPEQLTGVTAVCTWAADGVITVSTSAAEVVTAISNFATEGVQLMIPEQLR